MNTNNHTPLLAELRSAAKTLRVEGIGNTRTHKLAAELIDRAADALAAAYTNAQMIESFRSGFITAHMVCHPAPPSWRNAPADAQFLAMDSDGRWSWHSHQPYHETFSGWDGWDSDQGITEVRGHVYFPYWRDTLQKRPENANG